MEVELVMDDDDAMADENDDLGWAKKARALGEGRGGIICVGIGSVGNCSMDGEWRQKC